MCTSRSPGVLAKKRLDGVNGATASSKAKSVSQKAMGASATRKEKDDESPMQFKEAESINATLSTEEHLNQELPEPVNVKSMDMIVTDQQEPSSNQPERVKDEEAPKGHFSEVKVDAGANEMHKGGEDANVGVKTVYECRLVEKEADQSTDEAVPRTELAQAWRKDDPKGNDVIEETKSKLLEERKSRVKALVGAFESVLSFKE